MGSDAEIFRWIAGIGLAVIVAGAGWKARVLSRSGSLMAAVTGAVIVGAGGWGAGCLLVLFFVTSSAVSRLHRAGLSQSGVKGSQRDAWQVLANGGIAAVLAVAGIWIDPRSAISLGLIASIATANADTWATEIGKFSKRRPRVITTLRPVETGASGAVSVLGTIGALGGAMLIAFAATGMDGPGFWSLNRSPWAIIGIVTAGGMIGAFVDSVFGATVQARWWCPTCQVISESRVHRCGSKGQLSSGISWFNNDAVNATSITVGATVAMILSAV